MAKDDDDLDFDLDDINLEDDSWDMDFDDMTPPKDDRHPVKKIASGALENVKETLKSPSYIKRTLLKLLPPGYSAAADVLDTAGSELSDLYDSAAKELEPVRKLGIKATKMALPKLKGKLPKKIEDKLQEILDTDEYNNSSSSYNQEEGNITAELGEIFKTQMEHQESLRDREELSNRTETVIDFKKHKESMGGLGAIRSGIDKLVGYQDSINFKFQKKTLELQFKQYYAQRDLLEIAKSSNKDIVEILGNIMKNTALPEYAKVQTDEIGKQMLKERTLRSLGGGIDDFTRDYLTKFKENALNRFKMEFDAIKSMADMADVIDPEILKNMEEMGLDPMVELGKQGGAMGTDFITDTLVYKYKDKIPFLDNFTKKGNELSAIVNSLPARLEEYGRSRTADVGIKGDAIRFIKSLIPKFNMQTTLESDSIKSIDEAVHYDAQTRKSIVEIIPGYLARILRSIDIMRTGDDSTDLVSYDLNSNDFVDRKELKKTLINKMFSATNIQRANNNIEYVLEHIEKDKKLSPKARKLLASQMLSDSEQNKEIKIDRYLDPEIYSNFVDEKSKAKIIAHFKALADKGDPDASFAEELSRRGSYLRGSIPNTREMAQTYINAGYGDILRESGIVNKMGETDNLDFDKVLKAYRDGTDFLLNEKKTKAKAKAKQDKGRKRIGRRPGPIAPRQETESIDTQTYSEEPQQNVQFDSSNLTSFLDTFKQELFQQFADSRKLDEDRNNKLQEVFQNLTDGLKLDDERNIKLDEIIIRLDGAGGDDRSFGPGTRTFRERAKGLRGKLSGAASTAFGKISSLNKKIFNVNKDAIKNTLKTGVGLISNIALGVKDAAFSKAQDIYVKSDLNIPKIKIEDLKAGKYYDEVSGKVIKRIEDIKGRVREFGTDNVILDENDIQNGLVNKKGEKIRTAVSRLAGATFETIGKFLKLNFDVAGQLAKIPTAGLKLLNKGLGFLTKEDTDLYIVGRKKPILTVDKLKAGEYYHGLTGEVLTSFKDLKNGVKNKKGNFVLTPEQASQGLLSPSGEQKFKPFKFLGDLAGGALKLGGKILSLPAKGIGAMGKFFGKAGSGLLSKLSEPNQQVVLLTNIRDILDDRLGDQTVDRAGSAEDIVAKRKAGKAKKEEKETKAKDGKDKKGKDKKDGEEGGGITGALGGLGTAIMGLTTMLSWVGKALKLPFKAIGAVGRGAIWAGGLVAEGVSSLAAGAAAGTGVGGALAAGASAIGSGLTAVAGLLTAPVLIGGAAIAAVAYGGYKLYKYMKNKNAWLNKIRIAQYGVDPDDGDRVELIGDLEGLLIKKLKVSAGGYSLEVDSDTAEEILDIFDVDVDDKERMDPLVKWIDNRFKPIFLSHAKAVDRFAKGSSLMEADDKVPLTSKLDYIKITSFGTGQGSPYSISANPFTGGNDLPVGDELPKKYIELATAYYKKEMGTTDKPKDAKAVGAIAGTAVASAAAKATIPTPQQSTFMDKVGNAAKDVAKGIMFTLPGAAIGLSLMGSLKDFFTGNSDGLDAFTSVRMKAYGLKELNNAEQIKNLLLLESFILPKARLAKDGSVSAPIPETIVMVEYAPKFGIDVNSAADLERFFVWFKSRFLPVCFKYYSMIRTMEPMMRAMDAADKLKPSQKAAIAKELVNVKTSPESSTDIWSIAVSPFSDTESNTDKSSCNGHIKYLESQTSDKEVKTQDQAVKKTPGQANEYKSSFLDSLKDKTKEYYDKARNAASNLIEKGANAAKDAYNTAVDYTSRGMESAAGAAKDVAAGISDVIDYSNLPKGDGKSIKGDGKKNLLLLLKEMAAAGMESVKEKAMFLGQMSHESGGFTKLSEDLRYKASTIAKLFPKNKRVKAAGPEGIKAAVDAGAPAIAELIYGGRMGNENPGDGYKYRGRGFTQLTGKDNYKQMSGWTGLDLVNNPDLASDPLNAGKIALAYWKNRVGSTGGTGDLNAVTYKINGGYNGLADRGKEYGSFLRKYESGEMDKLMGMAANDTSSSETSAAAQPLSGTTTPPTPTPSTSGVTQSTIESDPSAIGLSDPKTPKAIPSSIAKPQPQQPQTAVAGLMNMNPFDVSGMQPGNKTPDVAVAAKTDQVNKTIESVNDKQTQYSNDVQNYQTVSMETQRKASSDYLNAGIDNIGSVLGEQLNVQKSIDVNIKQLVQLIQSGNFSQQTQQPQTTPVKENQDKINPDFQRAKEVRAPVSMRRMNV